MRADLDKIKKKPGLTTPHEADVQNPSKSDAPATHLEALALVDSPIHDATVAAWPWPQTAA